MIPICRSVQDAVSAIRSVPVDALRSAAWLEHEFLPALGLHAVGTWPEHLVRFQGLGLQSWQWPNQFSRYLANLSGRRIDSYLELGISHGGTFIITTEYLRRFNSSVPAVDIDIEIKAGVKYYQEIAQDVTVIESGTQSAAVIRTISEAQWGLALIDADHSEEGCWADYQAVRHFARLAAFHDITNDVFPGVGAVWGRLTATFPRTRTFEFTDQYPDVMRRHNRADYGIGLVEMDLGFGGA
jgi:cephalosporin hydroxylase